ncbi:hypothetical protein [Arenimonas caeni]|jgi:hypothetical protein|uniref:hypothetical protein n=1 Tax=Arenimonas caeni TaxID=2058085 RepID=UPI002A36222E|nr:hypothetical protein [Arenimonas caeni]MDY0021418.1 hypothetical protein [Arenimonas caeni]
MSDGGDAPVRATAGKPELALRIRWLLAALVLALCAWTWAALPTLPVFGNDEVHYYADFGFKLSEDGRWLNYALHDLLRAVPLLAWAVLFPCLGWVAFLRLGRGSGLAWPEAALFASVLLVSPPMAEQGLWPATTLPAICVLLFVDLLVRRRVPMPLVYLAGGALMFGTLQGFYFLLPLFYLGSLREAGGERAAWRAALAHLGWWIAGAVVGVLLMSLLLWWLAGHFGPQPAAWRQVQPIHAPEDLVRNLDYIRMACWRGVVELSRAAGLAAPAWLVGLGLLATARLARLPKVLPAVALLLAVALGFFAMSLPMAPVIQTRTLIALVAAMVLALAWLPGRTDRGRLAGSALLAVVGCAFAAEAGALWARHRDVQGYYHAQIQALLPQPPAAYPALALFGLLPESGPKAWIFNSPPYMHAIVHALGVSDYRDCRQPGDPRCEGVTLPAPQARLDLGGASLCHAEAEDGVALVWVCEPASR